MIVIKKLTKDDMGLAYSCCKGTDVWGSANHVSANDFLISNMSYGIRAYGIQYNDEPAGHAILMKTEQPFSIIEAENSLYIHCVHINNRDNYENLSRLFLDFIIEDVFKTNIAAIFAQSYDDGHMSSEFFTQTGFEELQSDENSSVFAIFREENRPEYSIKEAAGKDMESGILIVNYDPLCPLTNSRYSVIVEAVKEKMPHIPVKENVINTASDIMKFGHFGMYFNGIPLIASRTHPEEVLEIIRSLS